MNPGRFRPHHRYPRYNTYKTKEGTEEKRGNGEKDQEEVLNSEERKRPEWSKRLKGQKITHTDKEKENKEKKKDMHTQIKRKIEGAEKEKRKVQK